jgi:hypothetical protein
MTSDQLQEFTRKDLADMARKKGVAGWYLMRKEELVNVLADYRATGRVPLHSAARHPADANGDGSRERKHANDTAPTKDLSAYLPNDSPGGHTRDRIVAMVRDPYWLHCYWEVSRKTIQQAEAVLGQAWHGARPILRLLDVTSRDTSSASEAVVRDIEIHGGCNNWYIDVSNPPRSYRIDIGYRSPRGPFYALARSNVVTTPRPGASDVVDGNWADLDNYQAERLYAMSGGFGPLGGGQVVKQLIEERLHRPLGAPSVIHFGPDSFLGRRLRKLWFQMDAELIVFGATEPNARVTLQGEPIKLRADGTFAMRFSLPDSRQIIPATATACDGSEERTIVLAIERNTKELEPQVHELDAD